MRDVVRGKPDISFTENWDLKNLILKDSLGASVILIKS